MLELIHHDGSALYVQPQVPKVGERVWLRLRIPHEVAPSKVILRVPVDAEPRYLDASPDGEGWWKASFVMSASTLSYRWLVVGGAAKHLWVTAAGIFSHEVTDDTDFKITSFNPIATWATKAVAYQIFPDRFARSNRSYEIPKWAVAREWSQLPEGRSKNTGVEYFGGDLWGIVDRLDHIEALGANLIYTTPFFPARTTHRYDASTFAYVDPLLGGDEALIALVTAAHERGIKVIGDITLNHTGEGHEWFKAALEGDEEKRGYYYFDASIPEGYVSWLGHKSLPKLNFASDSLRREMITDSDSILRRYLKAPFNLDGWRVDVANMMGRLGDVDINHEVARLVRWAVEQEGSEKILIAEHNHNAGPDLPGDGWSGNMNYTSFQRPVWYWLTTDPSELEFIPGVAVQSASTEQTLQSIRIGQAAMPWKSLVSSWNLLGSHDSPRVRTMVGSRERQVAAAFLMSTLPGTPMIFAQDEIGAEGRWGEDSRTPFPWESPESWDTELFTTYSMLNALRISSQTLAIGGLRFVDHGPEHMAYLREGSEEALLILISRDATTTKVDLASLGYANLEPVLAESGSAAVQGSVATLTLPSAGGAIWRLS